MFGRASEQVQKFSSNHFPFFLKILYNGCKTNKETSMNFYEKMNIICKKIPEGKVATYGQIALLCGKPKNSRQVGYGLRENLAGDDVPAHRIVNSKGELSGAVYFEYPDLQKILLQDEGVEVIWDGNAWKVNLKEYKWEHSKEDILL